MLLDLTATVKMKVVTSVYRRLICFSRSLAVLPAISFSLPVTFSRLTRDDMAALRKFRSDKIVPIAENRWARGDSCFALLHQEQIISLGWVATKRTAIDYFNCEVEILAKAVCVYDHYTLPNYQQYGLNYGRVISTLQYYKNLGFERSIGFVAWENKVGIRASEKNGYQAIGCYHYWRWRIKSRYKTAQWGEEALPRLII